MLREYYTTKPQALIGIVVLSRFFNREYGGDQLNKRAYALIDSSDQLKRW